MKGINKFLVYSLSFLTIGITSSCTTFDKSSNLTHTSPSSNVILGIQDIMSDYLQIAQTDHSFTRPDTSKIGEVISNIIQYQAIEGVSEDKNLNKTLDQMLANLYAMNYNFEDGKIKHNLDRALAIYTRNPEFNPELSKDLKILKTYMDSIPDPKSNVGLPSQESKDELVNRIMFHNKRKQGSDNNINYPDNNLGFVDESTAIYLESQKLSIEYVMSRYGDYIQGIMFADELMQKASDSYIVPELGFLKAKGYESLEDSLKYNPERMVESIKQTNFDQFLRNELKSVKDITEEEEILDNSKDARTLAGVYSNMCKKLKIFSLINVKNNYIGSAASELANWKLKLINAGEKYDFKTK